MSTRNEKAYFRKVKMKKKIEEKKHSTHIPNVNGLPQEIKINKK